MSDILFQRLEKLRLTRDWTWAQVGEAVGVKTAMLMMVKSGKRKLSTRSLYKLVQAERAVGIAPPLQEQLKAAEEKGEHAVKNVAQTMSFAEAMSVFPPAQASALALTLLHLKIEKAFLDAGGLVSAVEDFLKKPNDIETRRELKHFLKLVKSESPLAHRLWREFWKTYEEMLEK